MSTSRAQSISSSRAASRRASKRGSRSGSMDGEEAKDSTARAEPRTAGGKVVNRLIGGETQDSNQTEQVPDPFAAEQTYLTDADIKQAQQRKGSYDELDQEMGGEAPSTQIDSSALASALGKQADPKTGAGLTDMFDNMQISVVGGQPEELKSDGVSSDNDSGDDGVDDHFQEDVNKVSQKHQRHIDVEARDREDMDFPDEVDTPFKDARKRFQKYRGIKSLKTCDWDPYENLPAEYSKIFRFQNLQAEVKQQRDTVAAEGLPLHGTYLMLVLEVEDDATFEQLKQD